MDWENLTPRVYRFDKLGRIDLHDTFIMNIKVTDLAMTQVYQAGVDFDLDKVNGIVSVRPSTFARLEPGDQVLIGFNDIKAAHKKTSAEE